MLSCRTKEEIFVCLKYDLLQLAFGSKLIVKATYERTFENSLEGDITKLSLVLDHDIRCCML